MRRDAAQVPALWPQGVARSDHVLRDVRAELEAVPAMTEQRSRIDHMAGPTFASDDFEGCTTGAPDLARTALTGTRASLGGLPPVEPAAGTIPRVSAAHPSFPGYTWGQVEAIHDEAIDRAETYVSPDMAMALHERSR